MRYLSFLILSLSTSFGQQDSASENLSSSASDASVQNSALPSDFFAGALADAQANQDELGTQRLVEVKSSELSPTISLSSALKYTSNPEKSSLSTKKEDGTTMDLSLMFMLGLGEYGLGDDVVCSPSLMLMHLRTYNDTFKDFGTDMRLFDVDVQIASLTFPFVLPNDYTLSVGNTYVRPISFRNDGDSPIYNLKVISFPIQILLVFLYQKLYLLKMVILLTLQLVSVMHIRMEILFRSHSAKLLSKLCNHL